MQMALRAAYPILLALALASASALNRFPQLVEPEDYNLGAEPDAAGAHSLGAVKSIVAKGNGIDIQCDTGDAVRVQISQHRAARRVTSFYSHAAGRSCSEDDGSTRGQRTQSCAEVQARRFGYARCQCHAT